MEIWSYIEQLLIGLLFLGACRQLWRSLSSSSENGCAKGCGDACPATLLQDRLAEAEATWQDDQHTTQKKAASQGSS